MHFTLDKTANLTGKEVLVLQNNGKKKAVAPLRPKRRNEFSSDAVVVDTAATKSSKPFYMKAIPSWAEAIIIKPAHVSDFRGSFAPPICPVPRNRVCVLCVTEDGTLVHQGCMVWSWPLEIFMLIGSALLMVLFAQSMWLICDFMVFLMENATFK